MTALARKLAAAAAATGPMRVADFMAACLTDPDHGYYTTRDPLGASGDFVTAPEISQMFGEMLGLWLAQVWVDQGRPSSVTLAELGPGRGTLMADILRAGRAVPGFADAVHVHLVEASPALRAAQADLLAAHALGFGLAPAVADAELDRRFPDAAPGTLVETCAPAEAVMQTLAPVVAARGGAMLVMDYGDWDGTGDTLQAVRAHAPADPLADAGAADLTAHVGFRWLAEAAAPLRPEFDTQGAFLERLGITARAQALARGDRAAEIAAQHRRLTHPEAMGHLFKVLALTPPHAPAPPGFAPTAQAPEKGTP